VGTRPDLGIDHSLRLEELMGGCVDSFGPRVACMGLKASVGTVADLVHRVAEQVSMPDADNLVFHNSWDGKEHQPLAVGVGRELVLYSVVAA
jgi:hypothetical protein